MSKETKKNTESNEEQAAGPQVGIQRLYVKNTSFESPKAPKVFLNEWKPELHIDFHTKTQLVEGDLHEVILIVTVTVKLQEEVAFVVEVHQAGIFLLSGFDEAQLKQVLGAYCPSVLYPYARSVITNMVIDGGFPQLYLAPVNFDAMYQQHLTEDGETPADAKTDEDVVH